MISNIYISLHEKKILFGFDQYYETHVSVFNISIQHIQFFFVILSLYQQSLILVSQVAVQFMHSYMYMKCIYVPIIQ